MKRLGVRTDSRNRERLLNLRLAREQGLLLSMIMRMVVWMTSTIKTPQLRLQTGFLIQSQKRILRQASNVIQ